MNSNLKRVLLVLAASFIAAVTPLQAKALQCSTATMAGNWAYTYSGTIFTPEGALPVASLGQYHQDASGNVVGSQVRSVQGLLRPKTSPEL